MENEVKEQAEAKPDPLAEMRAEMGAAIAELHKRLEGIGAIKNEVIGVRDLLTARAQPNEESKPQPPQWAQKPQEDPNK